MVWALVVGHWMPSPVGTNTHPMSPNTFYFQQQHLERPWGQPWAEPPLRPHRYPMS